MSFEKDFNKTIKLKIASIILFIVSILCAGGAFITHLFLSNMISDNFQIIDDFEFSMINTREEDGETLYDYNVKGSFISDEFSLNSGKIIIQFLLNDNGSSYSTRPVMIDITTPIEEDEIYVINYNFFDTDNLKSIWSINISDNVSKYTLMDKGYNKMFNNLFLPLVIIGGASLITSIALTISYSIKKRKTTNQVSTIQTTLQTTINTMKQKEAEELHCPYCNTKIEKTDKKCPSCGATL